MLSQPARKIYVIYLTALLAQMEVWYFPSLWTIGDFRLSTTLARIAGPLLINLLFLHFSADDLGFRWPCLSRRGWIGMASAPLLIVALVSLIQLSSQSQNYYQFMGNGSSLPFPGRALSFAAFTLSTLPAWEFLHRSFLLFGLNRVLTQELQLPASSAQPLIIASVCSFEVIFHFQKPMNEPLGMLLASPVLSLIALRSRSIALPLLLHHLIEAVFFIFVAA